MSKAIIPQSLDLTQARSSSPAASEPTFKVPGIQLGESTNLLLGYKSSWNPSDSSTSPFHAPASQPLPTVDAILDRIDATDWTLPRITLHDSANSLISAVLPYRVQSLYGDDSAFDVPAGPLTLDNLDHHEQMAALSQQLGVDLTAAESYMLVEIRRTAGTVGHRYLAGEGGEAHQRLTAEAMTSMQALPGVRALQRAPSPLTAAAATAFFDSYAEWGTHYVSRVTAGDRIFQVFSYDAEPFEQLRAAFDRSADGEDHVDGINAVPFQYYTTPYSTSTGTPHGYVRELGRLNILSRDPAFATSVDEGKWRDETRAGGDSIFMAFAFPTEVDLSPLQQIVPIELALAPLGDLISVESSDAGRKHWNRLWKGALLQKYGNSVRVTFPSGNAYDWKGLLPNTNSWLSTIATPAVDVYDGYVDLGTVQLTNRTVVDSFRSFSVVLEAAGGKTSLPGTSVSISSYLIDTSGPEQPPELELGSKAALDNLAMACGRMDGALRVGYAGAAHGRTLVDGVVLESGTQVDGTGRVGVVVTGDLFGVQPTERLLGQLNNLNFAIVTCQTLLYSRGDTGNGQDLSRDCLLWLTDMIPNDETVPQELLALRLRAGYLGHIARRLHEQGVPVPYLTYKSYQTYIESMSTAASTLNGTIYNYQSQIEFQKTRELTAITAEEINENVKVTGNLLRNYIDAVAMHQDDIAQNYRSIIATKQRELQSAITNFEDLAEAVADQKVVVDAAKVDFERAIANYGVSEIIKAVINISTAFVTVGFTIATPSNTITALKDLGETAQKIQKLVTILDKVMALQTTIQGTARDISTVNQTLDSLRQTQLDMPSSLEWSEMSINFDASLASTPSPVAQAKANFSAAFKVLVLRAQAMLTAQSRITQLNAEIALSQAQEKINEDQHTRVSKITRALHYGDTSQAPDMSEVDLLTLTGHVQSQLNQALASLAQALILQDSAVQFELLADPTPIRKFDLGSLQLVMASQQANIIAAKQAFNPPPFKVNDPIEVTVKGVPVSQFTGGNTFEFVLQPSISEFQPYNMVRVQQAVVDIPAISGSKSGRYRVDLAFEGNPFEDRDPSGDPLTFNTVTRYFGPFEYEAKGHRPVFGDQTGSIAADITRITPFSTWRVTMPDLPVNADLDFGGVQTVDIVLSFRIEALAQRALCELCEERGTPAHTLRHAELVQNLNLLRAAPQVEAKGAELATTSGSTVADMLRQMYRAQGVLKGWDCVLNMLEEPVNRFLAVQYQEKYPDAEPMTVVVGFCQAFPLGAGTLLGYTKVSVDLGPPLLEFQANNHNFVEVTQAIQGGFLQKGSLLVNEPNVTCPTPLDLDNPDIQWGANETIDLSNEPTVSGAVALGMVQGIVQPTLPDGSQGVMQDAHSVVLDFAKGSFVARDLNIDTDMAELNLQLSNWFVNNPIQYLINTVVFNDATALPALQPTRFKLNVLTTNSNKNVLQVFITTNGSQQDNLTINVNEPIPDGFHNSLMINSKIMFNDIFVQSFNKGSGNLQVQSVDPGNDFTAWKAKVRSGTVSGEARFNNTGTSQTRISEQGNNITWPLEGLLFERTEDLGLKLTYNVNKTVNFQHRDFLCTPPTEHSPPICYWSNWRDYSVVVDVGLTGNYPIRVVNTNGRQEVQIDSAPPSITITPPDLRPTGPCECNDNDLKIQVGNILRTQVPTKLQDSMAGISFAPVSVFALYNLLFPTQDFIEMKQAFVPADFVVLGTFNRYVDES